MFEKLSVGQALVSGAGALLISALFVLSAVSAAEVRIENAERPTCAAISELCMTRSVPATAAVIMW